MLFEDYIIFTMFTLSVIGFLWALVRGAETSFDWDDYLIDKGLEVDSMLERGVELPEECEVCGEPPVGFSEDGDYLCENCLFETFLSMCKEDEGKYYD